MKFSISRVGLCAAIVLAAALSGKAALAGDRGDRGDVRWSVSIGSPAPVYRQPPPIHLPPPLYPRVVYAQPAYLQPVYALPVHAQPGYYVYRHVPARYRLPSRWDHDGDGIPNRHDPVYNPRWDRDGNGVPDRYERRRDHRHDGWGR